MVVSNGQGLEAGEAVGVLSQVHWVAVHANLIHVWSDVVSVVSFAECVVAD